MKISNVQGIASWSAALIAMATVGVSSAPAQSHAGGEYIVNAEVVSDEIVGSSGDGTVYSDDYGNVGGTAGAAAAGGVINRSYGQPDLFYNYYTQGYANQTNAQMYLSPLPVPPYVGHTFGTYQPFYPEEYLYWHKNRYHNYYDNGRGMNRTRAVYYRPPVRTSVSNIYWNYLRLPR